MNQRTGMSIELDVNFTLHNAGAGLLWWSSQWRSFWQRDLLLPIEPTKNVLGEGRDRHKHPFFCANAGFSGVLLLTREASFDDQRKASR
ncbi:MAG: hypothetical protein ABL897_00885 [Hyphomicrobium sp.]